MSINSMTNVAWARRRDVGKPDSGPTDLAAVAAAAGQPPETQSQGTSTLAAIATYIPTEVVTLYVSVLAALGISTNAGTQAVATTPFLAFALFLVLTPFTVWAVYAAKAASAKKPLPRSYKAWPKWEMFAATAAFLAWATALPSSPFESFDWYNAGLGSVTVLMTSFILGLIAPIFTRQTLANS